MNQLTIDQAEVDKFSSLAEQWWDLQGPLKTLHMINPPRVEFIQKHTKMTEQRVLDIGCGGGILCEAMANLNASVVGIDASHEAIEIAKKHASGNHLNIEYVCGAIETYHASLFDVVTCMEMLEHVASPTSVVAHAARLLKPGGYLFLSTINRTVKAYGSVILAAEYILGLLPKQTHDYERFIKPSELAAICREQGLEVIDMAGMAFNPISGQARSTSSVDVNYLLACRK